ncbi:MAG: tyrosine-type recombinase/integrase [Succinivibrio sp.]
MPEAKEDPLYKEIRSLRRSPKIGAIFLLFEVQNRAVLKENSKALHSKMWARHLSIYENVRADRINPLIFERDVIEALVADGLYNSAIVATRLMVSVLDFAVAIGVIDRNPIHTIWRLPIMKKAEQMSEAMARHRPSFDHDEIKNELRKLFEVFAKQGGRRWLLLQISLRVLLRPAEVVSLKLSDLDLKRHQITARGTKTRGEFIIPTDETLEDLLTEAHRIYGSAETGYVFRGYRDPRAPLSAQTMNRALTDCGYKGKLCAHGIRSIGRNFFADRTSQVPPYISEAILQHATSKVERAYRRNDDYLKQRRSAMKLWWNFLSSLWPAVLPAAGNGRQTA